VKEFVKTRSSAQIRSHAQKYLIKLCKKFNVQDSKNLKSLKKKNNTDVFGGMIGKAAEMGITEDISHMDMDQIEETILGIFKSSGLGLKRPIGGSNLDIDDEAIEYSEEKKKVFNTVKEPKNKKKLKSDKKVPGDRTDSSTGFTGQLNNGDLLTLLNQCSGDPLINNLLLSVMGGNALNPLFNLNDNLLNLLGSDYTSPFNNLFSQIMPTNIDNQIGLDNLNSFTDVSKLLSDKQSEVKQDMNGVLLNLLAGHMSSNTPDLLSLQNLIPSVDDKKDIFPYMSILNQMGNNISFNNPTPEAKIDHFFTNFNKNLLESFETDEKNKEKK
jgi:hypothetical protein